MLDLRRLRLLHELHRRGTVGAVAEALSYSPSTVSQQLRVLEREAGTPLFEPAGRFPTSRKPPRRTSEKRHAYFDGITQTKYPGRVRERFGDNLAIKRVPAAQLQDIGAASMARKRNAERT